jgi:hypothetical protein
VNFMARRSSGGMRWQIRRVAGSVKVDADAVVVLGGEVWAGSEALPPGTVVGPAAVSELVATEGDVALLRVRRH